MSELTPTPKPLDGIRVYGFDLDPEGELDGKPVPPMWMVMIPITKADRAAGTDIRSKQAQIEAFLRALPTPEAPAPTGEPQPGPWECQVLTMSAPYGHGVNLDIAGLEIPLSLSDALRISRLLFEATEEMAGGEAGLCDLNSAIEAKEDHKPFRLELPIPAKAPQGAPSPAPAGELFPVGTEKLLGKILGPLEDYEGPLHQDRPAAVVDAEVVIGQILADKACMKAATAPGTVQAPAAGPLDREASYRAGFKAGHSRGAWSMLSSTGWPVPPDADQGWQMFLAYSAGASEPETSASESAKAQPEPSPSPSSSPAPAASALDQNWMEDRERPPMKVNRELWRSLHDLCRIVRSTTGESITGTVDEYLSGCFDEFGAMLKDLFADAPAPAALREAAAKRLFDMNPPRPDMCWVDADAGTRAYFYGEADKILALVRSPSPSKAGTQFHAGNRPSIHWEEIPGGFLVKDSTGRVLMSASRGSRAIDGGPNDAQEWQDCAFAMASMLLKVDERAAPSQGAQADAGGAPKIPEDYDKERDPMGYFNA